MASASSECYYLDTSALVKRYVEEPGSEVVDKIYAKAYKGDSSHSHLLLEHSRDGCGLQQV